MARIAGRQGRVYLQIPSTGEATPLAFVNKWSLVSTVDKIEVTALEDSNKTYVSGLPDATGTMEGFFDDASAQTYTAATDGIARKFYLYPNKTASTTYWFGTILPDFTVNGDVAGAVAFSSSFNAASTMQKVTS